MFGLPNIRECGTFELTSFRKDIPVQIWAAAFMFHKKILSGIIIAILIANLILFALGKVSMLTFWLVIGAGFLIAKFVLPKVE